MYMHKQTLLECEHRHCKVIITCEETLADGHDRSTFHHQHIASGKLSNISLVQRTSGGKHVNKEALFYITFLY